MLENTKFRILEVIVQNRHAGFAATRIALMSGLPELSWEEITDYVALLKSEGYVKTLYGNNELCAVALQRGAFARARDSQEGKCHAQKQIDQQDFCRGRIVAIENSNVTAKQKHYFVGEPT